MVNRQGSKLVENVTRIECSPEYGTDNMHCKVVSERNLPTRYRNIEGVDAEEKYRNNDGDYQFENPVDCEVVFGSELNRIKCRD